MIRRLVFLLVTSLAFYSAFHLIYGYYLSDIRPVASSEGPQSLLRFETAFVLTAIMWISLAIAMLTSISIIVLVVRRAQSPQAAAAIQSRPNCKDSGSSLR
jgi:hypothetical protein